MICRVLEVLQLNMGYSDRIRRAMQKRFDDDVFIYLFKMYQISVVVLL